MNNSKIYKAMSVFMRVKGDDVHVYDGGTDVTLDPQMTAKHANAPAINKQGKDESGVGATWKSSAAANVGDDLEYYVHLEIPAYSGVHNLPTLTLKDTLSGAGFTFYRSEADLTDESAAGIKFVKDGGYYRPATADEIAAGTGVVTEVPADFLIKGLNVGVYYMEETTVPGGYYAPRAASRSI